MPTTKARTHVGPFGGFGGEYYDAEHGDGEYRVQHLVAGGRSYEGFDVLNGFQFFWDDGYKSGVVGHIQPGTEEYYDFKENEKITSMTIYAGDNEGFVNGFEFKTNMDGKFEVGGKEGLATRLTDLGTGDLVGAEGRDPIHGAAEVVDSMKIYFRA
ncbi:hypothetical protein BJY04DRAFT_219121 [Aspergillus karnatakaensis]|uniref:uncharacterized protein n=1 Tax=Aspergillus karnatakaensis TaxID=1810916 RepID=UPI003CCD4701